MKNSIGFQFEKLVEFLEEIGLTSAQIECAENYLEHGDENAFKQLPEINVIKLDNNLREKCHHIFESFKKKGRGEEFVRCFNLLFAIGGVTLSDPLPFYGYYSNSILSNIYFAMLDPAKLIAVYTEKQSYNDYSIGVNLINNIISLIKKSKDSPEQVLETVKGYHKNKNVHAMIFVYCAYFKLKVKNVKGTVPEEATVFLKEYEKCFLKEIENGMFSNSNASSKIMDLKTIKDYLEEQHPSTELPLEISSLLKKYHMDNRQLLLAGCAFYHHSISHILYNFLNICLHSNMPGTFKGVERFYDSKEKQNIVEFSSVIIEMSEKFSLNSSQFLHWVAEAGLTRPMKEYILDYYVKNHKENYIVALNNASINIYGTMMRALKKENPQLAEEIGKGNIDELRMKYIQSMMPINKKGEEVLYNDLYDYICGKKGIDTLYLHKQDIWSKNLSFHYGYRSYYGNDGLLIDYLIVIGKDDVLKRLFTLSCLVANESSSYSAFSLLREVCNANITGNEKYLKAERVKEFFNDVDSMGLEILYQVNAMGRYYDDSYSDSEKILEASIAILSDYLKTGSRRQETLEALKKANASGRMIGIVVLGTDPENYKQELFDAFTDSSKTVKENLVKVISSKKNFRKEVLEKLTSKKATEREVAVRILGKWNQEEDREALKKALEQEKSVKVSALISETLGVAKKETEKEEQTTSIEGFVKNITKGNRKKTLAWAFDTPFSAVHDKEGNEVDRDYMMALLLCYSTMNIPGISKDAPSLAEPLNSQELSVFMEELFEKWIEAGAESKKKWVLYACSIHGGAAIVSNLQHYINEWPKASRGAIAAEAVKALALNSSPSALLVVDSISRKFKFRQVKNAAGEALSFAANQLGLTTEELADKIVPDLGFNEQMERIFDYGERQFKVYINQALEMEVYDNKDKKLKNLPAPGKRDDPTKSAEAYAEFKQMKKQMKTAISTQKGRLEFALSVERKWKCDNWKNLFIKNPIMHQFAISLIWGVYKEGILVDTFRYMEDGSFNTVDEEEYELKEDCLIGLVHPIELTTEEKDAWLEQLEDYEIAQSIEQLKRNVFEPTKEELSKKYLERFGGKILNGLSLHGKLSGMGWYRGSVEDAGGYYTLYREEESLGIGVELSFSGAYVGDENEDVTVYYAIFYKMKYENNNTNGWAVQRRNYLYDTIKDDHILLLKDVPKRYFSEIVYQLEKATASSTETDDNWRKDADWRIK